MRALILAAGRGTRMGTLSDLLPKPAVPVRGVPLIAYTLSLLQAHGVTEVMINLHHLPDELRAAVEAHTPEAMSVAYSYEPTLLGTGGAIRRVAGFLSGAEESLVLTGDMLLDLDLAAAIERHRERQARVSLLLREDSRHATFGTIGLDAEGCVRRIGKRFDLQGECAAGVFVGVRVLSSRAYDDLPEREIFEDLSDWFAPRLSRGARDICGEILSPQACTWDPVGTPEEYLQANLEPPHLSYISSAEIAETGRARIGADLILGSGATLGKGAQLHRAVVWERESVPTGLVASNGVFAGGSFLPVELAAPPDGDCGGARAKGH